MAQWVKNLPVNAEAIRDVGSITVWEDPLEKQAQPSVIFAGESHWQKSLNYKTSQKSNSEKILIF